MTVTNFTLVRRSNLYRKSSKNPAGTSYELKDLVYNIKWTTTMDLSAGELTFDLVQPYDQANIIPYTGDIIKFSWDKQKVFYGYVWTYTLKKDRVVSVSCYDSMRYLKNEDTLIFKANNAGQRFKTICSKAGIKGAAIKSPTTKLKATIYEGKTYFDMLHDSFNKTLKKSSHKYFLTTNYDTVELRRVPHKKLNFYIGDSSGLIDATYSVDIENTYNTIRVIKSDSKKHKITAATTVSGKSPAQWGKLQKVVTPKDKANAAQMKEKAQNELKENNLANKTLSVKCIGDLSLIVGNAVTVKLGDYNKTLSYAPITKAVHNFGSDYTCDLELKVGKTWSKTQDSN